MNKKKVAREWLLLIGLTAFGFAVLPALVICVVYGVALLFTSVDPEPSFTITFVDFYKEVYGSLDHPGVWVFLFSPYILVQFVRSIIWAAKAVKSK